MQENLPSDQQKNSLSKNEPQGIGGWLILVVIGLLISLTRLFTTVFSESIPALQSPTARYLDRAIKSLLYFELIGNILFALAIIFLLLLLSQRYKLFPRLIIIFYLSNVVFVLLDLILAYQIPAIKNSPDDGSSIKELARSIIGAAIWVPYFLVSKRVKNTFVN